MQRKKGLILGFAAGLLLTVSVASAKADDPERAHTRPNNGTFAGTFLSTRMDVNDDGIVASWSTAEVIGTLGRRTVQSVTEPVFTGVTAECPGGVFIIDAASGKGFGTITATFSNGDQSYGRILTRHQCGLGGGRYTITDTTETVGGTGKFEGASSIAEQHSTSFTQAFDENAVPPQSFGSFTGEFTGTITLP